jgi:hypothetical protein
VPSEVCNMLVSWAKTKQFYFILSKKTCVLKETNECYATVGLRLLIQENDAAKSV